MDEVQEPQDLLAAYGRMAMGDTAPPRDRAQQLANLVADLLCRTVDAAAVRPRRGGGDPGVFFDFEGRDYLITCALDDGAKLRPDVAVPVEATGGELRWSRLAWSRVPGRAEKRINSVRQRGGVVLDRSHVDAAVAGLLELAPLIREVFRRQECHLTLADLALVAAPPAVPLVMMPPDRMGASVSVPTRTWQNVTSDVALVGEVTVVRPTGMAWREGSLLVTCEDGLLELDPVRGRTQWFLALPGCHGAPLVGPDGDVLVMAGPAVVRWNNGTLTAVAGAFDEPGKQLMAGHDGEPWVLSGSGATLGTGQGGTLGLTRVGATVGDQFRYPLAFDAAVRSAAWLSRRRFFLAAGGHSAVADLERSTDLNRREDWIPTAGHYPGHLLVTGPDTVLSASTGGSGNRIDLHRTQLDGPQGEHLVEYQLDRVLGLAQPPGDGPAYLLASLPSNDHTHVRSVLTRISGLRPPLPPGESVTGAEPELTDWDTVSLSSRGQKTDYRLDRLPLHSAGQGEVFRAVHKASDTEVAFKRRLRPRSGARRRMEREVTIAQKLGGHPHVMAVLDHDPEFEWFVMPMAQSTLAERRGDVQDGEALRELVDAVCAGLAAAHEHGWVHRDIKPANILLLNGRWTVADWGIARRPRGETSAEGRLTNASIGSDGWAAPELTSDPHNGACFASDIYSLGQVIGWVLTGNLPQTNTALLPDPGLWRGVVRRATYRDPGARPQTINEFITLIETETTLYTGLPITRAHDLLQKTADGDEDAASQLLDLAVDQADTYELYLDVLALMNMDVTLPVLLENPARTIALVEAMSAHADGDRGQWPVHPESARAIQWLLRVSRAADHEEEWDLLEAGARAICFWDERVDQWDPQASIKGWLRKLTGNGAQILASVLREHPHSARHFPDIVNDRRTDMKIRAAVQAAFQG